MRITTLTLASIGCVALLGGCNNAKPPAEVQQNVADAQQDANKKVASESADANKDASKNAYDVAMAKADGDHKVATEKCEAMSGKDQKACKDQADAAYKMDQANAEAERARTGG